MHGGRGVVGAAETLCYNPDIRGLFLRTWIFLHAANRVTAAVS